MKRGAVSLLFLIICLWAVSCGTEEKFPIRNASEYAEKTLEIKLPLHLYVECDNCDLEIYRWIRDEVKFEYTKNVAGEFEAERLAEKLGAFDTEIKASDDGAVFKSSFNGLGKLNGKLALRVYIPQKTEKFEFTCKKGSLKIHDDMKGELVIRADKLDAEINKFKGRVDCDIKEGDFRLAGGELADGTRVAAGTGNISVKALYEPAGMYSFISKEGILEIFVPDTLKIHFTGDLPQEAAVEEYMPEEMISGGETGTKDEEGPSDYQNAVRFDLKSGSDLIRIKRFQDETGA